MSEPLGTDLTDEQAMVAFAPPEQSTVVTAAAGTGKTHTLIARAAHLLDQQDAGSAGEIVVLSFSRAAAAEVRRRLRDRPSLPYVAVWTFDAFATELLSRLDPDGGWTTKSYDQRIVRVDEMLAQSDDEALGDRGLAHVFIDEAQDLSGIRAEFVLRLLEVTAVPYTVFTDPTQAIYGFQSPEEPGQQFVDELTTRAGNRLPSAMSLTTQHRATTDVARRVMSVGDELTRSASAGIQVARRIHLLADSMPEVVDLQAARMLLRPDGRSTAVLCRSNAQALSASMQLRNLGLAHTLRRRAEERAVGSWLAAIAASTSTTRLDQSAFEANLTDEPHAIYSAEELWLALRRAEGGGSRTVDLARVAQLLLRNAIPDELNEPDDPNLVVSTIHRAKGLEFDNVIVVPGAEGSVLAVDDENEEARVMYVALSRACESIFMLRRPLRDNLRSDGATGRTIRAEYRGRSPLPTGIELLGSDTDSTVPAGANSRDEDAAEIQAHLFESDIAGETVELCRTVDRRPTDQVPVYSIVHGGRLVGATSPRFGDLLQRIRGRLPGRKYPERIVGGRIQMVDTVAGDVGVGRSAGVSRCGIWARVRLDGVGDFVYENDGART